MNHNFISKLSSWYYVSIISLILLVGIVSTVWTYQVVSSNAKKDLLINSASISNAFDPEDIANLTGTENDLSNLQYISLKNKLEKIRALNENVRFVYLWGERNDEIYFFADSEPAESPDYSPPGQVYEEATEIEKQVFSKELPGAIEFNTDRWGSWFTALTPIMDGEKVVAVMGMDVSSREYFKNIYVYTAIPVISTVFVLLLIIIGFFLRKNEGKYLQLKEKLISLASHDLRSPLSSISWIVDVMLEDKDSMKNEQKVNLENINERIKKLLKSINELLSSQDKKDK